MSIGGDQTLLGAGPGVDIKDVAISAIGLGSDSQPGHIDTVANDSPPLRWFCVALQLCRGGKGPRHALLLV